MSNQSPFERSRAAIYDEVFRCEDCAKLRDRIAELQRELAELRAAQPRPKSSTLATRALRK
jgi:uncharacterized small protein (DUF1192 family)